MGAMGANAPTAKKLWGDAPKSTSQDTAKMYSKNYECVIMQIMQVTTGALISA